MQEIIACDVNGNSITSLVQWDSNVYIYLSDTDIDRAYQVHFFNNVMDEALVVDSSFSDGKLKVKIPNKLLIQPYIITGYVDIVKNDESKCLYGFKINIRKKPKPSDFVYVESYDYISLEKILDECRQYANNASNSAGESANSASQSAQSASAAKTSQNAAKTSETNSKQSENNAKSSANKAEQQAGLSEDFATQAKSYAVGGTAIRENEEQDNAKYYYEQSKQNAKDSLQYANSAENSSRSAGEYAGSASGSAGEASDYASAAKEYADQVAADKKDIDDTIKNSLLASSEEILSVMEEYFKRAEELYRSSTIVCDGEIPARRARTIVEIDCHTPQRRTTGYIGIDFDGGTPAIRLLGE